MNAQAVCAVIVTYHPDASMLENIPKALSQVQGLVVVDNGSNPEELRPLHSASAALGFHLIENGDNLGIAEALNQGVRWARSREFPWVLLFDQDSKITEGFVQRMLATWASHANRHLLCSIHPKYVDPVTGFVPRVLRAKDGGPIRSITSGSLMPIWTFDKVGFFESEFFIDEVDTEYSFRIRAAGYLIADSQDAILHHTAGHPEKLTWFGFTFRPGHHSALRRYYISRNRIAVYRRYFHVFPSWILDAMFESFRDTVKCFLAERDRPRKFRNFLLGTWDGFTGRMGKREGL